MAKLFVRSVSVRKLLDNLFASAVGTVLSLRAFLYVSGYPSLGGDSLHFAHMLWGGLLMIASIIILLAFLGRRIQNVAAIAGGVGFGLFIDELGKFITRDNDYFFQPTIMLIYLIFVGLYFIIRELDKTIAFSEEERLVNALELSKEAVMQHFDEKERSLMISLLSGKNNAPMFGHLRHMIDQTVLLPIKQPWWAQRKLQSWYFKSVQSAYFTPFVVALLIIQGALIMLSFLEFGEFGTLFFIEKSIVLIGIASAAVSGMLVLAGLLTMRSNRVVAFQKIYRANLVSVLITQPFAFYVATFVPILALAINLTAMVTLQYLLEQERKLARNIKI